jgi:nicotinate-nucleotide--dimethylbenzimidazole phosphoribosyltransferase
MTPESIRTHLDGLAKPPGSLGRLEQLAARLCEVQQTLSPVTRPRACVLFAADHGVVAAGVSAWPSAVTTAVCELVLAGKSASAVMARQTDTSLTLVDVGLIQPPDPMHATGHVTFVSARVRAGTRNFALEPALTPEEFQQAWFMGECEARRAVEAGAKLLLAGELGIGNTTAAACVTRLILDCDTESVLGPGAGATPETLARKRTVITESNCYRALYQADPRAGLAAVCGLELAALAGFFATAHALKVAVLLDGFIATSAALIAETLAPGTVRHLLATHQSPEPGHALQLMALGLTPALEGWGLRLGEATGALTLLPLLDLAAALVTDMGTLAEVHALLASSP